MSGLFLLAFAGLLTQESALQPSTRATYQPPVVRPFEPGRDLGGEQAQGDRAAELFRRPLEAPVRVEAYARSYEFTPGDAEIAYEQGVASAEIRADQAAGRLDGAWQLVDGSGQRLYDLILIDPGFGSIEGGWRGPAGRGAVTSDGVTLTLEGVGTLRLEAAGNGWRGAWTVGGETGPASLIRPN